MPTTDTTDTATETTDTESETTGTATESTENGTAQATTTSEPTTNGTATATETTGTATETPSETTETATETTNTTTGTETTTTESTTTATEITDEESDADAELTAFAGGSSTRTAVLERLVTGPANASDIATRDPPNVEDMHGVTGNLSVSKTRSAIDTLRDRGLVELLVDNETPIYSLTAKGERILFEIERNDG
ncbi:winged helix-turn-helix domain-containing protein [Halococcus qingdaonensis]|uniref:winged helix-turn-helix domain-containing protein n=1 Tax=Halococcus qingdaonensis TaxID=224402 RepID=UPI002116B669|nr:winged helix-turn-helix domain-containing protein [Halococcus qingdaonensis]